MPICKRGHTYERGSVRGCGVCRKEWPSKNPEAFKAIQQRWRDGNKDKVLAKRNKYKENLPHRGVWRSMIDRCYDPNESHYANYGGRGIKVADRWRGPGGYRLWLEDMGSRPTTRHSVDRKNNDGDYEPGNCYWATKGQQARNRRSNVWITLRGETKCLTDWAKLIGVSPLTIKTRVKRGYSDERILEKGTGFATKDMRCDKALRLAMDFIGDEDFEGRAFVMAVLEDRGT